MIGKRPNGGQDNTLEGRLKSLKTSNLPKTDMFNILNKYVFFPMLADLINQTGLIHKTRINQQSYNYRLEPYSLSLCRKRPKTEGILNWLARQFVEDQEVLTVSWNGQLWCCQYWVSYYFMTAQRVRDEYYEKLREAFGGHDLVIVGNE